jgi:hypothetical protein
MAPEESTAVTVRDSESDFRPVLRWGRGQFVFPCEKAVVAAREALPISLDDFKAFMTTGTSPSRSPEKWRPYVTYTNYGIVEVEEGRYPYVVFDVEGHPQMREVIHFVPFEPAAKLLPALYEEAKDDPEKHGFKVKSSKTPEGRAKHQARLDGLQWTPKDCVSSQNKSGKEKPAQPNPMTNRWTHIPVQHQVKWCCAPEKEAKSSKKATGKRKDRNEDTLPAGVCIKTDVEFPGISMMASIPVGSNYVTKVVDGHLKVVVYGGADEAAAQEEPADVADDADEEE